MKKLTKGQKATEQLYQIKYQLKLGVLNYYEAKAEAEGPLSILNEEMAKISKKFNRKHYKVSFTSFTR